MMRMLYGRDERESCCLECHRIAFSISTIEHTGRIVGDDFSAVKACLWWFATRVVRASWQAVDVSSNFFQPMRMPVRHELTGISSYHFCMLNIGVVGFRWYLWWFVFCRFAFARHAIQPCAEQFGSFVCFFRRRCSYEHHCKWPSVILSLWKYICDSNVCSVFFWNVLSNEWLDFQMSNSFT